LEKEQQKKLVQARLGKIQKSLSKLEGAALKVKERIPQEKNIPAITLEIEDLAQKANIELASVKPLAPVNSEGYERVPIEIGFTGSFVKLIDFLGLIERSPVLLSVQKISAQKEEALQGELVIDVTLTAIFLDNKEQETTF